MHDVQHLSPFEMHRCPCCTSHAHVHCCIYFSGSWATSASLPALAWASTGTLAASAPVRCLAMTSKRDTFHPGRLDSPIVHGQCSDISACVNRAAGYRCNNSTPAGCNIGCNGGAAAGAQSVSKPFGTAGHLAGDPGHVSHHPHRIGRHHGRRHCKRVTCAAPLRTVSTNHLTWA